MAEGREQSDLEFWADMRDRGIVTEEDFQRKKEEILGRPSTAVVPSARIGPQGDREQRINNAFLIELVGGFLGFLGLGYIYAGRTNDGLIRLIAWWVLIGAMWTAVSLLTIVVIGLCLIPGALIVQFGGPIWSASELKKEMQASG